MATVRNVCVIGLGLIGGSLLRAAVNAGRIGWGVSASEADAVAASEASYDVEPDLTAALTRAAETDAIIVLAVPLTAVDDVLAQVGRIAPRCLITDVTSVKTPVLDAVSRLVPTANYVGGHPMTGTTESGWNAGSRDLFAGAAWVTCVEDDTDLDAWSDVAKLAIATGAHVIPVGARTHDEAVARISHLPHLFAAIASAVGAAGGPVAATLAAGSFHDATRVARTRPELVTAMTEGNRAALLDVLDDALGRLGASRGSLASTGGLAATVNAGNESARILDSWKAARRIGIRISLGAADARAGLRSLAETGGRITAIDGDIAVGETAPPPQEC